MRQSLDKIIIRLPDGMRAFIKSQATENDRSMNAEIIHQLKRAYGANEKSEATAS
ncbi:MULTISPECIES: Arc family DNA-binding protein [unclassified Brucella]|nr:hypothetical protein BCH_03106 [Brucella sp. 191011898]